VSFQYKIREANQKRAVKVQRRSLDRPLEDGPQNWMLGMQRSLGNQATVRALAPSIQRQDDEPGKAPRHILSPDERMKTIEEVSARIADVARKWTLAVALAYVDKKTEPDQSHWGPLIEGLFSFAGLWVGTLVVPALAKAFSHRGVAAFMKSMPKGAEMIPGQIKESASKLMEVKFKNIHDSLVMGVGYWVKDKAKIKETTGDEKWIATSMSDLIGYWAQTMRQEYIGNASDDAEGDLELLSAEEMFAAEKHSQAMYNQRVVEDWDRIQKNVVPVAKGEVGIVDAEEIMGEKGGKYRLKMAYIYPPADTHRPRRLAVVYEFMMLNPNWHGYRDPSEVVRGDYGFKEWADDDLTRLYDTSPEVRARKHPLRLDDLVNAGDEGILSWLVHIRAD
jgi:hypothetical protein